MKRNNAPHLGPRIPGRSQPGGDLLKAPGVLRGSKPPGPGQQGRGHALISSYPNRGSPHVLAAAGIAGTSSSSVRRLFHKAAVERGEDHRRHPGQKSSSSNEDWSTISSSGSPRRFGGGGISQVTSNNTMRKSNRDQFETSDMSTTRTRSPRGGADNLTAHHSPLQRKQEVSSAGVLARKRSSGPDLKRNKSPPRPKTASEKQKEWIMKYGKLVEVESPRQVRSSGSREVFRPSLMSKMVTSSMISKPLEETKKSLMHLEALKDSLKKNCTRESLLAPFMVRHEPPPRSLRPREVMTAVNVKEVKPRRIVIRREDPPPTATKKQRSNNNRSRSTGKAEEKVVAATGSTETVEEEVKSVTSTSTGTSASGDDEPTTDEEKSSRVDKESSKKKKRRKKSQETRKEKETVAAEGGEVSSSAVGEEGPCRRCRNMEAREQRRINDLMTENKSLTFMLGQKRSLVLSLQHQVKVLLTENQKTSLRLMLSKKKVEKLEKLDRKVVRSPPPGGTPPPPPATPVPLLPSSPAELESKIHGLTRDLRSLQLSHEKSTSFLSSLLCTLNSRGYETLTDPSGNTIDLSKCCGDVMLEMKGRDHRLKVSGGGGGDSPRPRRIASGQELMLKSVIGSQEEFIRKMSIQFQDLHRANFIRGLVREDEEVADGVLNLLEIAVRRCPAVVPAMKEQLASTASPGNSRLMAKILERLGGLRETKFTPTVAAGGDEGTTGLLRRQEKMMRSTSGLDNQPKSEEGRSRKCLEGEEDEEDCPGDWKDVMSSGDEVPQETKDD